MLTVRLFAAFPRRHKRQGHGFRWHIAAAQAIAANDGRSAASRAAELVALQAAGLQQAPA
jgi:hypothetical protein